MRVRVRVRVRVWVGLRVRVRVRVWGRGRRRGGRADALCGQPAAPPCTGAGNAATASLGTAG